MIKKCEEHGANKEKLIAHFMVEHGIARRTMLEYVQALRLAEKIIEKEDLLFLNKTEFLTDEEEEVFNGM